MKVLSILGALAVSLSAIGGANATVLTGSFSGSVARDNDGRFTAGQAVTGSFSFDTADQSVYDDETNYVNFEAYTGSLPYQLSISIGDTTFLVSSVVTEYTQVANRDSYYDFGFWTTRALTHDYTQYTLTMDDYAQNVSYLANTADLSTTSFNVDSPSLELSSIIDALGNEVDFGITSMSVGPAAAVPEPTSLAIVGAGLAALIVLRRRGHATRPA